jgi:hypothetical protein
MALRRDRPGPCRASGRPPEDHRRTPSRRLSNGLEAASERISGDRLAADGGLPAPGLIRTLPHEEALRLSHLLLSNTTDEERFS